MSTFAHPEQRVFFWAASLLRVAAPSYRKIRQAIADEPRTNKARNDRASMQLITTAHTAVRGPCVLCVCVCVVCVCVVCVLCVCE